MNKKDKSLLLAIILLLILLSLSVWYLFHLKQQTNAAQEMNALLKIDRYIENGYIQEAQKDLLSLSKKDLSAVSHLRLLKRSWRLSQASYEGLVQPGLLEQTARNAYDDYPARSEIAALFSYALLRSGRQAEAVEVFDKSEIPDEDWSSLATELQLYRPERDQSGTSAEERELAALSRESSAERFIEMYEATGSHGFLFDAVLLLLENGRIEQAFDLARRNQWTRFPPKFRVFLSYDAGKWETALSLLQEHPQLLPLDEELLLKGDLFMRLSRYEEARSLYEQLSERFPGSRGMAFYNMTYLDLADDGQIDSMQALDLNALNGADAGADLALDLVGLLIAYSQIESAERLLSSFPSSATENPEYLLLREQTRGTINVERYASLLWRMADREEEARYALHLAWFLTGIEDMAGLYSLVEYGEKKYGASYWTEFCRGILNAYTQEYEAAAQAFQKSFQWKSHWEGMYNAALMRAADEKYQTAVELLERAELAAQEDGVPEVDKAKIYLKKADIYLKLNMYSSAETALGKVENLDPKNVKMDILRRMLADELED